MSSGAAETEIDLNRSPDTSNTVHSSATLDDYPPSSPSNSEKYWSFQTTPPYLGLQLAYEERTLSTHTALSRLEFTWAQNSTLNSYIGTTVTRLNPGTGEVDKETDQTLDPYGNLTQMVVKNFGSGAPGSVARTYHNTYLGGTNYTSRYIFNRLLTSTVTDASGTNSATLVSNTYDQYSLANITTSCSSGGLCEHDNTNYPYTFSYRGLVNISTTPSATTTTNYDMTGNAVSTIVNGVTSSVTTTNNYAVPWQTTTNSLTSTMNWNISLSMTSVSGPNGITGSISYDGNARPHTVTSPYGAVTTYTYNDSASPPNTTAVTCPTVTTCNGASVETQMDGFGRTIHTISSYGGTPGTTVSTVDESYAPCGCSPLGKLSKQSQPYAPGDTEGWTTYSYDASGRTVSIALPDGSPTTYQYQGNVVTVTDAAGNWKKLTTDAFGNLISVLEPDPTLGYVTTTYTYDVLNHLTQITMPRGTQTQTRTFNYTNPSHIVGAFLLSASNPENGTVTYTYSNNLLATKTDAKGQQFTYQYDTYNRLKSVTLASAPSSVLRTYYYDTNPLDSTGTFSQNALGRLTAVQYPAQQYLNAQHMMQTGVQMNDMFSYTSTGLTAVKRLQVNQPFAYQDQSGHNYNTTVTANLDTTFTYNNEGAMNSITYPSTVSLNSPSPGPTYNYSYDSMYRLNGMTDGNNNTIVSNVSYDAANQLLSINYPGANETRLYNSLGQLTALTTSTYNYQYVYPTGSNNGKISNRYEWLSGEAITYQYDSLNRMVAASDSVNNTLQWSESYSFDPFGNLYRKHLTGGSGQDVQWTVSQSNNQMASSFGYDANGNVGGVANGNQNYTFGYDPDNRIVSATLTSNSTQFANYAYDAQNRRIWGWTGALDALNNMTNYTANIYMPGGQKLAAYTLTPQVYSGINGTLYPFIQVAVATSDKYFGSRRLAVMDRLGSVGTYFPWGEAEGSTNPLDTWSYGTYWRDSLTGMDYAKNRYYTNGYGRFMTPDPYASSGGPSDPQSWNRYAYTSGDPINRNDPQGLVECETCFGDGGGGGGDDPQDPGPGDPTGYCPPEFDSCDGGSSGGGGTGAPGGGGGTGTNAPGNLGDPIPGGLPFQVVTPEEIDEILKALGQAAAGAGIVWEMMKNSGTKIIPDDCPASQREATPTTQPDKFGPIKGSPCKVNNDTGEIWCQDYMHGRDHWEVYKNKKKWDNGQGTRSRSVWNDGCIRQRF